MRNLYKPVRYNVASIQAQQTLGGDCMESNENGIWVEFRDYLRLLEDYKSLQELKRDAEAENARLKAEVDRLTKAGDLMCRMAGNNQVINRHWKTAKKGVQS